MLPRDHRSHLATWEVASIKRALQDKASWRRYISDAFQRTAWNANASPLERLCYVGGPGQTLHALLYIPIRTQQREILIILPSMVLPFTEFQSEYPREDSRLSSKIGYHTFLRTPR